MKFRYIGIVAACLTPVLMGAQDAGCDNRPSADLIQRQAQEKILLEGTSAVGMPAIHNFRERRLLKDILELRDQDGLTTYTYTYSEVTGKFSFFCNSIGYPIPYSTEFTNPQKLVSGAYEHEYGVISQADPNGLFSPSSAEGTWVMCLDPNGSKARPVYIEPKVTTSTFKLAIDK